MRLLSLSSSQTVYKKVAMMKPDHRLEQRCILPRSRRGARRLGC